MTYSATDISGLVQIALRRPVVVPDQASAGKIDELLAWVAQIPSSAWRVGDGSEHSWDEYYLTGAELDRLRGDLPLLPRLADLATHMVGWINRFGEGSWIGSHRDAGGDVQCIIPLELPAPHNGGTIWIGCPDLAIPMDVGDLLLFNASSLPHGTSTIVTEGGRRITINLRFWIGTVLNAPQS
jgi:hypothetical protein